MRHRFNGQASLWEGELPGREQLCVAVCLMWKAITQGGESWRAMPFTASCLVPHSFEQVSDGAGGRAGGGRHPRWAVTWCQQLAQPQPDLTAPL